MKIGDRVRSRYTGEYGILISFEDFGFQNYKIKILMDNGEIKEENSLVNYIKILNYSTK
jgi:hypothetical protein